MIDPNTAESLIQEYSNSNLDTILEKSALSLSTLSQFAYILGKAPSQPTREIAKRMLVEASVAGDANATLRLLASIHSTQAMSANSIVRTMQSSDLRIVRMQLEHLAYKDGNPDAMVLLGQLLEREGKDKEPFELYHAAIDAIKAQRKDMNASGDELPGMYEGTTPQRHDPLLIPAAWTALGNLLLHRRGDLKGAKDVFTVGALKADDPLAYFYLAELEDKHSAPWLEYTTKAAASGHPDAAYNLATFYALSRAAVEKSADAKARKHLGWLDAFKSWTAYGMGKPTRSLSGRTGMAWEWYHVAAQQGHKMAGVALAKRCRTVKNWSGAAMYLVQALRKAPSGVEEWPAAVREAEGLRRLWLREDQQAGRTELEEEVEKEIKAVEEMRMRMAQR